MKNKHITKAIRLVGGPVKAGELLEVSYQTVQAWERAGQVPPKYCPKLEEASKVSRRLLCPKDHELIWPITEEAKAA